MAFEPFEVTPVHLIYVGLGFFIVIFGILSLFIKEKLYLGEAPIAAVFGIIVGPAALNLFDPSHWANNHSRAPGGHVTNEITLEVMRVTIALSVFAVGVELPKKYVLRHWRSLLILLGPVMLWGWLVTAGFIALLIPGLDFLNALVVAACVTPTDPILAQAVVGGPWAEKHVPAHIRHMLMCESGCNDGAAFPFLYLALFLTTNRGNTGAAIGQWFYDALAYQIIFGTILGALIGFVARKAMRFSERHHLVDRESFVAQYVSLAIASMGVNVLLGSDDLLAAFACGTAFAWDGWFTRQTEDSNFSNIVDLLFNVATFIYIGALMPWWEFANGAAGNINLWRLFVLAIAVILLRRFPVVLALWRWIPDIKTFREAVFSGHFAPMGVGAIFIATLGRDHLPEEVANPPETTNDVLALSIQPIVFFLVLCSITVHGLTVPFFAFSKRATTITRTWSRHPSFSEGGEPGWMNRMRRFKTGDTMASNKEVEGGGMTEIQRVLNAQLGVIGKGAIGGDAEKELRRDSSSGDDSSGSRTRIGLLNTRTERDLELAEGDVDVNDEKAAAARHDHRRASSRDVDDIDDYRDSEAEDPSCEWGGDNTAEMKLYRAKREAKREEARRRQEHHEEGRSRRDTEGGEGDIGEAPMDREMIWGDIEEEDEDEDVRADHRKELARARHAGEEVDEHHGGRDAQEKEELEREHSKDTEYPKARSWLEGNKLVIEYLDSRCAEPDVHVVNLTKEEAAQLAESGSSSESESASVAHSWLTSHVDELDEHVKDKSHRSWHPAETAKKLVASGALQSWLSGGAKEGKESKDSKSSKSQRRNSATADDETEEQRRDRADMLYAAMNWRDGKHYDEDEERKSKPRRPAALASTSDSAVSSNSSASSLPPSSPPGGSDAGVAGGKRSSRVQQQQRRSSSSKSPQGGRRHSNTARRPSMIGGVSGEEGPSVVAPVPAPRQHVAKGTRRSSMRRKILTGRMGFGGRRGKQDSSSSSDGSADEEEDQPRDVSESSHHMPRTASIGGLSTPTTTRDASSHDVISVLRSPEELDRERRSNNRTPSASVSFLNTTDTKHDRGARGNTFGRDSSSTNSSASSGMALESSGGDDASSSSGSTAVPPSSSSSRKGPGQRLTAFLSSLGSSSNGGGHGNGHSQSRSDSSGVVEAINLPQDEREHQRDREQEDPVANLFFGVSNTGTAGSGAAAPLTTASAAAPAPARPGPISRTFPEDLRAPTREGTPKEGILGAPEADNDSGSASPNVAFDLPRS